MFFANTINFMDIFVPAITLAVIGAIFGALIAVMSKAFYVEPDTRVEDITSLLPGYNCSGCGRASCHDMATSIVEGKNKPENCKPINKEQVEKIKEYLKKILEEEKLNEESK